MGLIYYYQIPRMQEGMERGEATVATTGEWESNSNSISPILCVGGWLLMMTTTVGVNGGEAGEMKEIKVNDK